MTPSPNRPPQGGRCSFIALTIAVLLVAGVGRGADRIEIIIDNSAAMWGGLGGKEPRVIALREALGRFAVAAILHSHDLEVGLRTMGGRHELIDDGSCDDTGLIVSIGPVNPTQWSEAIGDLFPRGRRPLARSVSAARDDLADSGGRIILITAGGDECRSDVATVLAELAKKEAAVNIRVIGLSMDRETARALTGTVPFRNLSDTAALLDTLFWAAEISGGQPAKQESVVDSTNGDTIHPALRSNPPVTIAVTPESPIADGSVLVEFWGTPGGPAWVAVASADAPLGSYLVRKPVTGSSGMVELRLPGMTRKLEARVVHETSDGVLDLLGRAGFQCIQGAAKIDAPKRIENGTTLSLSWEAPDQPGEHITIALDDGPREDFAACIRTTSGGPATLTAPIVPGSYKVRYFSSLGKILTSATLEVFEVLATLEGPAEIFAGEELEIRWTGPNEPQDFLSIADPGAENEAYLEWTPTAEGNPLRLRAPRNTGEFELRYVRAADGEVLARRRFSVIIEAVSLQAPPEVEVGSRFVVEWTGTPGGGDFIAIAKERAAAGRHLDWAYTTAGRRLTLAAPNRPGRYEVRYVSGSEVEILARQSLEVR